MSSCTESGKPGLEGLLDLAERALAAVMAQPLEEELGDARLAESVQRLYRLETMAAAEKLRRIAEVDAREAWREKGVRSTAGMLVQRLRLTRGEARRQTETAVALARGDADRRAGRLVEKGECGGRAHIRAAAGRRLVELARRALDGGDLPQVAVQRPHVILIRTVEKRDSDPGAAASTLDGVGPVSGETAEMVCCDAEVTEVFMTRNGEVLDAGRTRKQPTRVQRVAVIARDRTCVGCGAPAARCEVHRPRQPPPPTHPNRSVI